MRLVRSAILAAAAATVVLAPTVADADTYRHTDAVGDVYANVGEADTYAPAPDRAIGDVVSNTIKHKKRAVLLQLAYRDLVNNGEIDTHVFFIRTSRMTRTVRLYASSSNPGGKAVMYKGKNNKVRCHVRRHIDYTLNTAKVVVPRSCLGNPRWVKVGMGSVMFSGTTPADTTWVDDALSTGTDGAAVWSPKVRR
jgi:hypothetical protein